MICNVYAFPGLVRKPGGLKVVQEITPEMDDEALKIIKDVESFFGVSIISNRHRRGGKRDICEPRQIAIYLISKRVGLIDANIAEYFPISRVTCTRSRNEIEKRLTVDKKLQDVIENL